MNAIPIALQMYTLREACGRDFFGTLQRVADLGFDGVELSGYGGYSAKELKKQLDQLGLRVAANHVPPAELHENLAKVIEDQKILQCDYLVCPYLPEDARTEEGYRELIAFLQEAGKVCKAAGMTLCYHNHDFELKTLADGRLVLDAILQETKAGHVEAEFDIYWLAKAGENPVAWIDRYQGRTPLVHLKDMTTDGEKFFAELGTGGVDIDAVLQMQEKTDVKWWIIEQDECHRDPFDSVETSLAYLKARV